MAVLSKEEILARIAGLIGERTDDDALAVIEDVTDTLNVYEGAEDWKAKYEETDRSWREKYKARFLDVPDTVTTPSNPAETEAEETQEDKEIEDLFGEDD